MKSILFIISVSVFLWVILFTCFQYLDFENHIVGAMVSSIDATLIAYILAKIIIKEE
jgi:hypothetical protein